MKLKWLDIVIGKVQKALPFAVKKMTGEENSAHANRLIHEDTSSRVLEAYRMTRTNLLYTGENDQGRVFGFTGAAPHDGKSLTCANLAISFAMSGKKVLLIDCDMHRPTQNISFGIKTQVGLSEYLTGIEKAPQIVTTEYQNLSVLTAGRCPPNPAELLYSERFSALMAEAKEKYDCVFLDLPPFNVISDAAIVSPYLDGYVFVVRAGRSDRRLVRNAIDSIEHVGGKILGFVLNDTDRNILPYNRTTYYGGYYYYNDRRRKKAEKENATVFKKSKS